MEAARRDDDGRLGVVLADFVAAVVALGAGEVCLAALGLAPGRVVAVGVASSGREVGPVAKVEPQLRGCEARHVLLCGANQGGEVVLGRARPRLLVVVGLEAAGGAAPAELAVGAAVASCRGGGEVVVRGGVVVELEDVVGVVGGDGGVAGRGEERQRAGLQAVTTEVVVVVLPVDAAAPVLVVHDREKRRRRRVGSPIAELVAGVPSCGWQVHHPSVRLIYPQERAEQRTRPERG